MPRLQRDENHSGCCDFLRLVVNPSPIMEASVQEFDESG